MSTAGGPAPRQAWSATASTSASAAECWPSTAPTGSAPCDAASAGRQFENRTAGVPIRVRRDSPLAQRRTPWPTLISARGPANPSERGHRQTSAEGAFSARPAEAPWTDMRRRRGGRPNRYVDMTTPHPNTDTFARPYVISWNLTYRCNLACEHCYLDAGGAPLVGTENFADRSELDTEGCFRVIDDIAAFAPECVTILTGGEPLLRRDILEIVRRAAEKRGNPAARS